MSVIEQCVKLFFLGYQAVGDFFMIMCTNESLLNKAAPGTLLEVEGYGKTHFMRWGQKNTQTPIIVLHKVSGGGENWIPVLNKLEKHFDIIAPDLLGHGYSNYGKNYSLIEFASHIAAFIEALNIPKFYLMGHSLGARIALKLTNLIPDKVRAVVCIEPPLSGPDQPDYPFDINSVLDWRQNIEKGGVSYCLRSNSSYSEEEAQMRTLYGLKCDKACFNAVWKGFSEDSMLDELDAIQCPVNLIYGDKGVITADQAEQAKKTSDQLILTRFLQCGHNPPWEQRTLFTDQVIAFLKQY